MNRITVKPAPGLLVRDPVSFRAIPEEGREVEDSPYWRRRLIKGDVELVLGETHDADAA